MSRPTEPPDPLVPRLVDAVWTRNKARLIERYLFYFLMITKNGTYIDAFAGPQNPDEPESWSSKLVLELEPKWLKHFYLFDKGKNQIAALEALKLGQPLDPTRTIEIYPGDVNLEMIGLLRSGKIKQEKEAVFCLLDQRTFECHWSTVEALAGYKTAGRYKIELFYFLANSWLDRALAAQKDTDVTTRWWGREDWTALKTMGQHQRVEAFIQRFKSLGYGLVNAYPIFQRDAGEGTVMYFMIHATDHRDAPTQMARAYNEAVQPRALSEEQIEFPF